MQLAVLLAVAAGPDLSGEVQREVALQECGVRNSSDEIVVCGRRGGRSPYQVSNPDAPFNPRGDAASVARERSSWIEEGDTGIHSCSPVGPAGYTGCTFKEWKRQRQQQGWYM